MKFIRWVYALNLHIQIPYTPIIYYLKIHNHKEPLE